MVLNLRVESSWHGELRLHAGPHIASSSLTVILII